MDRLKAEDIWQKHLWAVWCVQHTASLMDTQLAESMAVMNNV